jgi:hypothetical protein
MTSPDDDPGAAELAQLLALAATLSEEDVEDVPPVFGPQEWE